jgi:CubicO group peptidase (beta-lactamase class C family)
MCEDSRMRLSGILACVLVGALAGAMAGSSLAAPSPGADPAIREAGRAWVSDNAGIGLTIGIYDHGRREYFNFGVSQIDGNHLPTPDTVYEIGSLSKTFAGQLLARAVVEGRVTLEDEVAAYLDGPYPNLENGGRKVLLRHLVSSTSQLIDNIPDLTQVRAVPGEPLAVTHMRVFERYSREQFLLQLGRVMPRRPPGDEPAYSNVGGMVLGVALEKIYGEPFERILAREIEKPMRMASGTAPPAKLLARGHTAAGEPVPPFTAPLQFATLSLRYSAKDLLTYATWQLLERDASTKLAHRPTWSTPDGRQGVGFFWILGESPQGAAPVARGHDVRVLERLRALPGSRIGGGGAIQQGRGRRAGFPARTVREDRPVASAGDSRGSRGGQTAAFVSRRSAAGSLSGACGFAGLLLLDAALWLMSMLPENWAPSAMPTRGAKMLPLTLADWRIDTDSVA